ncbi:NUAK family SNF1-like kinase 1 [Nymphon striatum]|nr:NUAK family SNF1-like kinase 1 [Nymphon striatum]
MNQVVLDYMLPVAAIDMTVEIILTPLFRKFQYEVVAIKTIKKSKIESEQDLIRIKREIQIMSCVQHPHIIHIYEVFENKDKIVLVMQYASGGELYDYLNEKKVLSEADARRLFRQIASAIYYCHKHKICHRDLKLENIFLDEKGNAKIGDFGLSNIYSNRGFLTTFCGSPLYASPEIVQGTPYYGPEVDCWSLGVLLYTLVYGAMPFDGSNFKRLVKQISEGDYYEPKKKSEASGLIRDILTVSPAKRANIVDICSHWWVNQDSENRLTDIAEDLANLTPVRLDFLFALDQPETAAQDDATAAPSKIDQENAAKPNGITNFATEPDTTTKEPQSTEKSTTDENKNGYLEDNQQLPTASENAKRRSLSVPDIAERAMDLFVNECEDQSNKEKNKRREDNDSRSVITPNDGRKKKPRMGISALGPTSDDNLAANSIQDSVMENESEPTVDKNKEVLDFEEKPEDVTTEKEQEQVSMEKQSEESLVKSESEPVSPGNVEENKEVVNSSQLKEIPDNYSDSKPSVADENSSTEVNESQPKAEKEVSIEVSNIEASKETSPTAKKSTKVAKPNMVKRVKKKPKEQEQEKEIEESPKTTTEVTEVKTKPKSKEDRVVKRPKKLSIPKPIPQPDSIPTPDKIKVPGKISDLKKAFEGKKATPKRPVIVPSRTVSDAKKAFENSSKESSSPPVVDSRRRSSTTSLSSKKSSNSQSPVTSSGSPKKESSPLGKESPKVTKPNKLKSSTSKSTVKASRKSSSRSPVKCPSSTDKPLKVSNDTPKESVSTTEELNVNSDTKIPDELLSNDKDGETKDDSSTSRKSSSDSKTDAEELSQTVSELFIREDGDELPEKSIADVSNDTSANNSDANIPNSNQNRKGSFTNTDDLKSSAKDILKRNIAKAKLTDRKLSKQNSLPEEPNIPSTPVGGGFFTPPVTKSAFKLPKPYQKDEDQQKVSKAEIILKSQQKQSTEVQSIDSPKENSITQTKANKTEVEERVSDSRRGSNAISESAGGHAITKSFRKFTFTKDGKCIEETGKIFQNDSDGEWTTIKTTKVSKASSKPSIEDASERLPPRVERSDSTSSSGPDDIFEDFFDSFTGDSMSFGLKHMSSLVKKHFGRRHPLFQKHPTFDQKMGSRRRSSSHSRKSSQKDYHSQDEDLSSDFDFDSFGSQNIQHLLKNFDRDTDDFFHHKFSTLGRRSSKLSDRDSRSSLFDRFMSSDGRPNSAFGRSASNDRQRETSPNSRSKLNDSWSSFHKPSYSRQSSNSQFAPESSHRNIHSDFNRPARSGSQTRFYASPDHSTHFSATPDYSRQSSQFSGIPNYSRQSSQFSAAPEYSRQSSQYSTTPECGRQSSQFSGTPNYSRQSSQFSAAPEYSRQNSQYSTAPEFERQSSQFSAVPDYNKPRGYPSAPEPSSRFSHHTPSDLPRGRSHVTSHTFSSMSNDEQTPQQSGQHFTSNDNNIPRKTSVQGTVYSRQNSQSPTVSESSPHTSDSNDGGFKATIKLTTRSGFEPPNVEHSAYGTIRPHIRIRYTRGGSGGCEDGEHCGTPERDVIDSKCPDGKNCGTPPPENSTGNVNSYDDTIKVDSPSVYATMKPHDTRKYVKNSSLDSQSNSSSMFEAKPESDTEISHNTNKSEMLSRDASLESNDDQCSSRSKSKSPVANNGIEESFSTMSLLESLKSLGYADVMKSRQSQADFNDAQIIADVRAKRLAGGSSNERLNILSGHSFSRQDSYSSERSPSHSDLVTPNLLYPNDRQSRAKSEEVVKLVKDSTKAASEEKTKIDEGLDEEDQRQRCGSEGRSNQNSEKFADSVSERIRRKSYFTRFNDDRPRRNKKSSIISDSRRNSGYLNNSFEDNSQLKSSSSSSILSSNRRVNYSSLSRESSIDKSADIGHRSSHSGETSLSNSSSSSSFDSSVRNMMKNNTDWFQEVDARATQLFDEMYEHDARMLQSLPLRGPPLFKKITWRI